MKFHGPQPRTTADFAVVRAAWRACGWRPISPEVEARVGPAWRAASARLPGPWRRWDVRQLWAMGARREAAEADFTLKLLAAFRRLVPRGETLFAIDWQHGWYDFDPHAGVAIACREQWAVPVIPDGDAVLFAPRDFRFGTVGTWPGKLVVFGAELLAALESDPPRLFLEACRLAGGRRLSRRTRGRTSHRGAVIPAGQGPANRRLQS